MELEDMQSDFDTYLNDFNSFFGQFLPENKKNESGGDSKDGITEYWVNEETGEVRPDEPNTSEPSKPKPQIEKKVDSKYKKLFKNLSIKTHPDRGGNSDDFLRLKKAYDTDNLIEMVDLAVKYDIVYELDTDDEILIEKNIKGYESEIDNIKKSLAWIWCTSKNPQDRINVIKSVEKQIGKEIPLEKINLEDK